MGEATSQSSLSEDVRLRRRADYAVCRPIQLRWDDVDTYGHINNAVNYTLMDTAINGWLIDATGVDIRALPAIGVVVETQCRYFTELHFTALPELGIRLEAKGRSSVRYEVGFFVAGAAEPVAVGRFVHVYIDALTRRPVAIPDAVAEALLGLNAD